MTSSQEPAGPLTLAAATAADLMTPNLVSIGQNATVKEAVAFLTARGFSAAPVMDEAGRPVGVLSRADVVVHHRHKAESVPAVPEYYERTVRDIMTPVVFAVASEASARRVIGDMLGL